VREKIRAHRRDRRVVLAIVVLAYLCGGRETTRYSTAQYATVRHATARHSTAPLRSAFGTQQTRRTAKSLPLSLFLSLSLSPSFSLVGPDRFTCHLSTKLTGSVAPRTTHRSARDARLAVSRNARIRLRACPTEAGGERLAERVSLARAEALDVRPYIKMASRAAWHPLAKPPRPISRTLPPIATTLRRDGIHTAHRFRSPHTSAARALTSDATLYVILRAATRQ